MTAGFAALVAHKARKVAPMVLQRRRKFVPRSSATADADAARAGERVRNSFDYGPLLGRGALLRAVNVVVNGSAPEALKTLAAIPPEREHAEVRTKLLVRVLRQPTQELKTRWYQDYFALAKLLPTERAVLDARLAS